MKSNSLFSLRLRYHEQAWIDYVSFIYCIIDYYIVNDFFPHVLIIT